MFMNPRRKRRGGGRRRSGRSMALSMGGAVGSLKSVASKPILAASAGLIGGNILAGVIWKKYGPSYAKDTTGATTVVSGSSKLPLAESSYGPVIYGVGIPAIAALLLRKYPNVRNGLLIEAARAGISGLFGSQITAAVNKVAGTSAYIRPGLPLANVGRLPGPRNHTAVDAFSSFGGKNVFPSNAWARR